MDENLTAAEAIEVEKIEKRVVAAAQALIAAIGEVVEACSYAFARLTPMMHGKDVVKIIVDMVYSRVKIPFYVPKIAATFVLRKLVGDKLKEQSAASK